jgi:hypothetical protein
MKYLCQVYIDEQKLDAIPDSEFESLVGQSLAYDEELRKSGHFITAQALQRVLTASTVRVRKGKMSITDGPFAETKEQLGGFILINANDLNDAIQIASRIPMARWGSIEVRPIRDLVRSQPIQEHAAV